MKRGYQMSDSEEYAPILIEFSSRPGVQEVAFWDKKPEELKEKSEKVFNDAIKNIEDIANRISVLQKKLPVEFSQVEVEFGINFDLKMGAMLAEASTKASINVKLTCNRSKSRG